MRAGLEVIIYSESNPAPPGISTMECHLDHLLIVDEHRGVVDAE